LNNERSFFINLRARCQEGNGTVVTETERAYRLPEEQPMNLYDFVPQSAKMLKNLDAWIEKAVEHAKAHKFDPEVLASARLAPDQYDFSEQIQSACDAAKFAAAYLSAKEAPAHPDEEKTLAELRARIRSCLSFLETVTQPDFVGAGE